MATGGLVMAVLTVFDNQTTLLIKFKTLRIIKYVEVLAGKQKKALHHCDLETLGILERIQRTCGSNLRVS